MARTRIRTSLAALAAAALLVTAGCGVDQSDNATEKVTANTEGNTESPDTGGGSTEIESGSFEGTGGAVFLNQAAEATAAVDTQKIWMEMEMTGIPQMGTMTITAEGAIDNKSGLSQMTMDMGSIFESLEGLEGMEGMEGMEGIPSDLGLMEVIVDGDTTYVKSGMLSMFGDSSKPWMKMATEDQGEVTEGLPGDPTGFLDFLEKTGSEVEEVGNEEVRGAQTTHLRTVLDIEGIMDAAPSDEQADLQQQLDELGGAFSEIPLEAWVDDDGMVRRISMAFDFTDLGDAELDGTGMNMTIEMYDFGEPVDITVPDPSQVSDLDTSMMMPDN